MGYLDFFQIFPLSNIAINIPVVNILHASDCFLGIKCVGGRRGGEMHYFFQKTGVWWQNLLEKQKSLSDCFLDTSGDSPPPRGLVPSKVPDAMRGKNKSRLSLKLYLNF